MDFPRWQYFGDRTILGGLLAILLFAGGGCAIKERAPMPPAPDGPRLAMTRALEQDVRVLAGGIGVRDKEHPAVERKAADYIEASFRKISERGSVQRYEIDGATHCNIALEIPGSSEK